MSLPKGNFVALQPLKPVEYTYGDIVLKRVDDWIKQGQYERAAKAKADLENNKFIEDTIKDIAPKPTEVMATMNDVSSRYFADTVDEIDKYKNLALQAGTEYERSKYLTEAKRKSNEYLQFQQIFGGKQALESYQKMKETINSGDYFEGDERVNIFKSLENGMFTTAKDEYGNTLFYPASYGEKNEKAKGYSAGELSIVLTSEPEKNFYSKYTQDLVNLSQKVTTETTNDNGYVSVYEKKFDPVDAKKYLITALGYNPDESLESQFDKNTIPKGLNQFFWNQQRKNIQTNEDFQKAIDMSLDIMKTTADEKTTKTVKKTAAEIEADRLRNIKLRQDIANNNKPKSSGSGSSSSDNKVAISNVDGGIMRIDGKGKGQLYNNGTLINLNNKEYIAGFKVKNKDGKGYHSQYAILGRDEQGRFGFKELATRGDVAIRLRGYNYDPAYVDNIIRNGSEVSTSDWTNVSSKKLKSFNQARESS